MQTVVTTAFVAENLGRPGFRIVDASFYMAATGIDAAARFREGHLPGAQFFDLEQISDTASALPHMLPAPELFAASVGTLGIGSDDTVVVYDQTGIGNAASRVWWMFRVFGHDRVTILDGGLPGWRAEGRPTETGNAAPAELARFQPGFRPELVRSIDDVAANIQTAAAQLVDARAAGRFEATAAEPWANGRAGHVPGARNLPYTDLIDPATQRLRPDAELARLVDEAGIDPARPIVASCGSGVTACVIAAALHKLGHENVAVYDGSWAEWGLRTDLPLATGPAGPTQSGPAKAGPANAGPAKA